MTVALIQPGLRKYRVPLFNYLSNEFDLRIHSLTSVSEELHNALSEDITVQQYRDSTAIQMWQLYQNLRSETPAAILSSISDSPQSITTAIIRYASDSGFVLWSEEWRPRVDNSLSYAGVKGKLLNRPFVSKRVASAAETLLLPGQGWHKYWNGLGIPEEKIVDVGQCSLDMSMREHNDLGYEDPVVLYLGRIIERKGLDVLIRALSQVDTNATLVVGGDGSFRDECRSLAEEITVDVDFVGRIPESEVGHYYANADLFVLPSCLRGHYEPYGLTVNESMSVGTPVVVTTAVGASRAIVKDGVNGRVVQEGNENVLATAIEDLLSSPDILNEMGREAKRSFVEFNDYNRMASQFERGIREAIE